MKKYITPIMTEEKICNLFAICEPSPGSGIKGDAPGISGSGTGGLSAPRRKVF